MSFSTVQAIISSFTGFHFTWSTVLLNEKEKSHLYWESLVQLQTL